VIGRPSGVPDSVSKGLQMKRVNRIMALLEKDTAQDLIEYALLAALLALCTMGGTQLLGGTIINTFWVRIGDMLGNLL
jgi:Flp pilus assembly pilin Flp